MAAAVFGFAFLLALFPLRSLDVWWHMANGREIAEGRGIPTDNCYSFTYPEYEVMPTHWLFGLGSYYLYRAAGVNGLVFAKAAIVGVVFLLAYALARRRGAGAVSAALIVAAAVLASRTRFLERPHVFTMLGVVVFAWLVRLCTEEGEGRERRGRLAYALPAIAAVWANLHAGCLFGVGIVGLEAGGKFVSWMAVRRRSGAEDADTLLARTHFLRLTAAAFACALAVMISPAGWGVYTYNLWHVNLDEVIPLLEMRTTVPTEYPLFYLMLAGGAALIVMDRMARSRHAAGSTNPARPMAGDALVFVTFGALAVYAVRGVPNFAILAVPIVAPRLDGLWERLRAGRAAAARLDAVARRAPIEVISACLLLFPVLGHIAGGSRGTYHIGLGIAPDFLPEASAAFVADELPPGRTFTDLSAGGYLAWQWYPKRRIFVDGRTNAYPPAFLRKLYRDALDDQTVEHIMRTYGVDTALLHFYRGHNRFWPRFDLDRWAPVHADGSGVVLMLRSAKNRGFITRHEYRLGPQGFQTLSGRLAVLGDAHVLRTANAAEAALRAEERSGDEVFAPDVRAALLQRSANGMRLLGNTEGAIAKYRAAIALRPDWDLAHANLGWMLLDDGQHAQAKQAFQTALRLGPRRAKILLGLADSMTALGDREAAAELYREIAADESASESLKEKAETELLE